MSSESVLKVELKGEEYQIIELSNDKVENKVTNYIIENIKEEDDQNVVVIKTLGGTAAQNSDDGEETDNGDKVREVTEHVCGKCLKTFSKLRSLKSHINYCKYSGEFEKRRSIMAANLQNIEKESEIMEKKDICFCCEESYDTCHSGFVSCNDCPKKFKSQTSVERHCFLTHSDCDKYRCSTCNAQCPSGKILQLHQKQHQSRGKPFACKTCGKEFTRQYHVVRHKKFSSCGGKPGKPLDCYVCGKEFIRLDNLRNHLRQHLNDGAGNKKVEFSCPFCDKMFTSSSTLNLHIRTHTGERPFQCDLCPKTFPSNVSLRKHRRYHTGERPYVCTVCSSAFVAKEVLNRHMKIHTGEKPHGCDICGKRFIQNTQLKNHLKRHAPKAQKVLSCDLCEDSFNSLKLLQAHLSKEHNKLEGFVCEHCDRKFASITGLRNHVTKKICRNKAKVILELNCNYCNQKFTNQQSLDFHILKSHEGELTDAKKCMLCQKVFKQKDELIEHLKNYHRTIIDELDDVVESGTIIEVGDNIKSEEGILVQEILIDEYSCQEKDDSENFMIFDLHDDKLTKRKMDNDNNETLIKKTESDESLETDNFQQLVESFDKQKANINKTKNVSSKLNEEDQLFSEEVKSLLGLLVDADILKKFGWPSAPVEQILYQVIENCGHKINKKLETISDYNTRMREYVKLLLTVVVDNESICVLLNNHPIDVVIKHVLSMIDGSDDKNE